MTRSERSRLVRKRIYDATYQLVNEKGSSYTIQDVCQRAGVSVGSFYHFYARKEAVANDIYIFFDAHMSAFLPGVRGTCSERIAAAELLMELFSASGSMQHLIIPSASSVLMRRRRLQLRRSSRSRFMGRLPMVQRRMLPVIPSQQHAPLSRLFRVLSQDG